MLDAHYSYLIIYKTSPVNRGVRNNNSRSFRLRMTTVDIKSLGSRLNEFDWYFLNTGGNVFLSETQGVIANCGLRMSVNL